MRSFLVLLLLVSSALAQTVSSGGSVSTGSSTKTAKGNVGQAGQGGGGGTGGGGGGGGGGQGGPLTYPARTDLCSGNQTDPNGKDCTGLILTFLGRNTDATNPNSPVWTDTAPNFGALTGINTCQNDPDFGSKICRVTDYTNFAPVGKGRSFNMGSEGSGGFWNVDSTMFMVNNNGGGNWVFSFSADANMTSTLTAIGGNVSGGGGNCPKPATTTPCTSTSFASGSVQFSNVDPLTMWELDISNYSGTKVIQINKLTINKVNPADPTTWNLTRVKAFNFECEGGSCPTASATENMTTCLIKGISTPCNTGTSTHNGMVQGYFPTWSGTFQASSDDQSFTFPLSDNGQGGKPGVLKASCLGGVCSGAVYLVNWTQGRGVRVVNSFNAIVQAADWGDPTKTNSGPLISEVGGPLMQDKFYMHEANSDSDSRYGNYSHANQASCSDQADPSKCTTSCTYAQGPQFCATYFWEIGTNIVRPCTRITCQGHHSPGFVYDYRAKFYTAQLYGNPALPGDNAKLLPYSVPVDQHGSYNNSGTLDLSPAFMYTTNVCGQAAGNVGSNPCDPDYQTGGGAWYDEVVGVENQVTNAGNAANSNGQHCDYGSGPAACVYRFAHTFNTGTNWHFSVQNAIGNTSPDGRFALFGSDMNLTLGCTDGSASGCLDPISASSTGNCTGPGSDVTTQKCARGDVFVVSLTSAHQATGRTAFISETVRPSDALGVSVTISGGSASRNVVNTIGLLDSLRASRGSMMALTESIKMCDVLVRLQGRNMSELVRANDNISVVKNTGAVSNSRSIADSLTLADFVQGTGTQAGVFKPNAFTDTGDIPFGNPTAFYDADINTGASGTATTSGGTVQQVSIVYTFGSTFAGTPASVTLFVTSQSSKDAGCTPFTSLVQYSTNGGLNFTNVPNQGTTHAKRTDSVALSTSQDLRQVQIRAVGFCSNSSGSGSQTQTLFDAFVQTNGVGGGGGSGSWTKIQEVALDDSGGCNGSMSCSVTIAATGTNNVIVVTAGIRALAGAVTFFSATGGGTYVECAACYGSQSGYSGGATHSHITVYTLSSTPGATTVTLNIAGTSAEDWAISVSEWSWSGSTVALDTGGFAADSACTSCAGVALTLTGSSDVIIQTAFPQNTMTNISGGAGYTSFTEFLNVNTGAGIAGAVNTTNGTAPTWTQDVNGITSVSAIALKGS